MISDIKINSLCIIYTACVQSSASSVNFNLSGSGTTPGNGRQQSIVLGPSAGFNHGCARLCQFPWSAVYDTIKPPTRVLQDFPRKTKSNLVCILPERNYKKKVYPVYTFFKKRRIYTRTSSEHSFILVQLPIENRFPASDSLFSEPPGVLPSPPERIIDRASLQQI